MKLPARFGPVLLAGLAGLSGYVPLADSTAAEAHAANRALPIFLADGRDDGEEGSRAAKSTDDQQPGVVAPIGVAMPAENHEQHHDPAKKSIESDVPDGKFGADLFDQQVEHGEQQCSGKHE